MKFKTLILIFFLTQTLTLFACLDASQHKIFPIGVLDGKIISLNAHIHRTHSNEKKLKGENKFHNIRWIIKSYISIYDNTQKLISKTPFEESQVHGDTYLKALQDIYLNGIGFIEAEYKHIDYFIPEFISFCDFQKQCEILEIKHDTINRKDYLKYKSEHYSINLNEYQNYKKSMLFSDNLTSYYLSSTRIYKTKHLKVIIGHLETGHEISMGWITNDPNKKPKDEYDTVIVSKEYQPEIAFDKLENAIYEEPLLHHGYGFDFFIVIDK